MGTINVPIELTYLPWQIDVFFNSDSYKYVVVPKGRRVGATKGAINAMFDWAIEGVSPMLWVDTINGNIDRYFERYMMPNLKQLKPEQWRWNANKKVLHIMNSVIDFRSADAPESIEGFGYKKIFLNEAGIILKDEYLYNNTILPMMLDFPESQLFAIGVPKGIHKKNGNEHTFHILYQRALNKQTGYRLVQLTSFDNPKLSREDIEQLADEMANEQQRQQEIYGQFVDNAGENPFAESYDAEWHESENAVFIPNKQLIISIDFNLSPFAVVFSHIWKDSTGLHFHTFRDAEIARGSIPAMIKFIDDEYRPQLANCIVTGDRNGKKGELSMSDQASYFEQLRRGLGLRHSQIVVPVNPFHETSRADCNYILHHSKNPKSGIEVSIHPKNAKGVSRDLKNVQCDAFGEIIKRNRNDMNQRGDFLDGWRYTVNTFLKRWIVQHQKMLKFKRNG